MRIEEERGPLVPAAAEHTVLERDLVDNVKRDDLLNALQVPQVAVLRFSSIQAIFRLMRCSATLEQTT